MAYTTIFLLFCELRAGGCTATRVCTPYHCACVVRVRSRLSFLKLFTDTRSEAGHETSSSFWLCDRNLNLLHRNAFFELLLNIVVYSVTRKEYVVSELGTPSASKVSRMPFFLQNHNTRSQRTKLMEPCTLVRLWVDCITRRILGFRQGQDWKA